MNLQNITRKHILLLHLTLDLVLHLYNTQF